MRREDEARSKLSLSWLMLCFSFCSDARRLMLTWITEQVLYTGVHLSRLHIMHYNVRGS